MERETLPADELVTVEVYRDVDGRMAMQVTVEGAAVLRMHAAAAMGFAAKLFGAVVAMKHGIEAPAVTAEPADIEIFDSMLDSAVASAVRVTAQLQAGNPPTRPAGAH
jgi:hypothetical protein